jgi:succinate dehydrogenase / fumarate reductase flavoprotein subunit
MSESLRNDGRVWVPKDKDDTRKPNDIPEDERYYYLEEKYPSFGNLVPRDVASRNAKLVTDDGMGVGETGLAVYLDFRDAIKREGKEAIKTKYGNLFDMYQNITDDNPYETPMRIFPAVHYTMGGLWVDYNLMSNIPGLFVAGEANFSDHGANRLGASALMQGLSDGYFIIPYTVGNYISDADLPEISTDHESFKEAADKSSKQLDKLLNVKGDKTVIEFHRELGKIMWDKVGISRNKEGLEKAIEEIRALREEFWQNVRVPGEANYYNKYLEFAARVADFFELAELMAIDALDRSESCGCHLRDEYQTEEGEALRNDEDYSYVSAWEFLNVNGKLETKLHKEDLNFEFVELKQRSYK